MVFADKKGRVSLLKGVVKRQILLHATFLRFRFKVYNLVPYFENSTTHKC